MTGTGWLSGLDAFLIIIKDKGHAVHEVGRHADEILGPPVTLDYAKRPLLYMPLCYLCIGFGVFLK